MSWLEPGWKLNWRGPTSQHSEKTWEMIVNPDVDGYTNTRNHRKILRKTGKKTQKGSNLLNTKRILKPKCKLSGFFTFRLPGRTVCTLVPRYYHKACTTVFAWHNHLQQTWAYLFMSCFCHRESELLLCLHPIHLAVKMLDCKRSVQTGCIIFQTCQLARWPKPDFSGWVKSRLSSEVLLLWRLLETLGN